MKINLNSLKTRGNIDLLNRFFQPEIIKVFSRTRKELKKHLSGNQIKLLDDCISNKKVSSSFFSFIVDNTIDNFFDFIILEVMHSIIGKDNVAKFLESSVFTVDCYAKMLEVQDERKLRTFCQILDFPFETVKSSLSNLKGYEKKSENSYRSNEEQPILIDENPTGSNFEAEVAILKKSHEEQIEQINKDHAKAIEDIENSYKEQIDEYKETIDNLKSKINESNSSPNTHFDVDEKETTSSDEINQIIYDLQNRYLIGNVSSKGINLNQNMILISSIQQFFGEMDIEKREEIKKIVDCRNDYPSFVHFINPDLIANVCKGDFYLYLSLDRDDKYDYLFNKFAMKTIIFKPEIKRVKSGEKSKLNAIIEEIYDYIDFSSSTSIPVVNESNKVLTDIKNLMEFKLDNYSPYINSNLKYIKVGNNFYEVDCYAKYFNSEKVWVSKDGKYKKLNFSKKLEPAVDFIETPDKGMIYIQNNILSDAKDDAINEKEWLNAIGKAAINNHLSYSMDDIYNFHISVKSSQLVILAGASGIGKTRLPLLYAKCLNVKEEFDTLRFIPISPSFLEPNDLLGYVKPCITDKNNGVDIADFNIKDDDEDIDDGLADDQSKNHSSENFDGEYQESPSMLVSFLKKASENKDKLHVVIFDEMNLSQIEYWFAPFISILEKDPEERNLVLYSSALKLKNEDDFPNQITIGDNVIFIGTINTDETTKHISDRLNDRALVINLAKNTFKQYFDEKGEEKVNIPPIPLFRYQSFINRKENYKEVFNEREIEFFDSLNSMIRENNPQKEMSFRNLKIISYYLSNSEGIFDRGKAFDYAFKQTVLNKLNGSYLELENIVSKDNTLGILKLFDDFSDISSFNLCRKATFDKIKDLELHGYTK